MEKLDLNYKNLNNNDLVNKIKKDPLGKDIIKQLKLDDNEIEYYYDFLKNYISINRDCKKCISMNNCSHSSKGYIYQLKKDIYGNVTDSFTICNFYKDYYTRKNNLVYSTFDIEELLDESQKNFVLDNSSLLGLDFVRKIIKLQKNEKVAGAYLKINNPKIRLKLVKSLAYGLLLNHNVVIVKFSDLLKQIKAEFKTNNGPNTFKIILESDILIIDGIGNEAISVWSRDDILLSLLDNRQQMEKTTILCSEFELDDLKKLYKISYNDDIKVNQIIEKISDLM